MPTQETQLVDSIITSRRTLLATGGAALAALALPSAARAASTVTSYTDADILNFALNLEYLEANFYYLAAFGTTIDKANPLYPSGAMVQGITGTGTQGTVVTKPAFTKTNFTNAAIGSYAIETAIEEGKHVAFLRSQLGTTTAVAQPQLDLYQSFWKLANAAGITPSATTPFDPFASDAFFLIGAYVFEDVGVSAYHGAAPLITQTATGKAILAAAVGIHAVEAYHAGMIRTTLNAVDNGTLGVPAGALTTYTQQISALRATLANQIPQTPANPDDPNPDDYGLATVNVSLAGGANVPRSQIVDADPTNVQGFARSTSQVLNIVTGGGATTAGTKATGIFFPNGLNGLFS